MLSSRMTIPMTTRSSTRVKPRSRLGVVSCAIIRVRGYCPLKKRASGHPFRRCGRAIARAWLLPLSRYSGRATVFRVKENKEEDGGVGGRGRKHQIGPQQVLPSPPASLLFLLLFPSSPGRACLGCGRIPAAPSGWSLVVV